MGLIEERIKRASEERNRGDLPLEESILLHVAQVCHEANRAICQAFGDDSQQPFEFAPQWQRESAVKGVAFHMMMPEAPPSLSHESWMAAKLADGWVYGEEKDEEKKTHPCLVPFDQLPKHQQAKDYVFTAIVKTLMGPLP